MANDIKPYVYWVKDKNTGQKYTGVRWHNVKLKLSPDEDLGKRYFSSASEITAKFKKNPNNFIYKVLRTFESQDEAINFELKLNKKNIKKNRYLNRSAWPQQKYDDARIKKQSEAMIKRYKDPEERRKVGLKLKGLKRSAEFKKKLSKIQRERLKDPKERFKISQGKIGHKHSAETRKKISEIHKLNPPLGMLGKKQSDAAKKKMRLSALKRGSVITEEGRKKISLVHKGIKMSPRAREKMSRARKGIKLSEETKKRISLAQTGKKRGPYKMTAEGRENISKTRRGIKLSEETKNKISLSITGKKRGPYKKNA